jgi:hypothetical protein
VRRGSACVCDSARVCGHFMRRCVRDSLWAGMCMAVHVCVSVTVRALKKEEKL